MPRVLHYFAHPGRRHSTVNKAMWSASASVSDTTRVDLYAEYPRLDIDIEQEQQRLRDHDVIVFQFPLFWYSTPAIIKEWQDLVLEIGFAYGDGGEALAGKRMLLAVSAGGPEDAYSVEGYNHFPMRTLLTPLEQTARLCKMQFLPPYVLFASLRAEREARLKEHVNGFVALLTALSQGRMPTEWEVKETLCAQDVLGDLVSHG